MLYPNAPVPKHLPGCSNINAALSLCIFAFLCQLCIFSNISLPKRPSPVLIKHHPGPALKHLSAPRALCYYIVFCSNTIYLNLPLPQHGSAPCNTLLLQRPQPQSASAPMPSASTYSASKCLKPIVPLLQRALWQTYFCPNYNAPLLQRPLQQRASAPIPLCSNAFVPTCFCPNAPLSFFISRSILSALAWRLGGRWFWREPLLPGDRRKAGSSEIQLSHAAGRV